MTIKTIAVCGAGTMGRGIAQVCAASGFRTIVYEPNESVLRAAKASLESSFALLTEKGKISVEEKNAATSRLYFTSELNECRAELVIEAIIESPDAKCQLYSALAAFNTPKTIYASNTSSLSISALADAIPCPERFAGLHFFNPAPQMKLVEVVRGRQTLPEVIDVLTALVQQFGKVAVICADAPGFIVNRVARPFYIEALRLAEEDVSLELIDQLMEARGFKMGPFRLMDLIGNDVNYAVSCSVYEQLHRPERLRPSSLQQQKVESGALGRKTGRGYYAYGEQKGH